jgi:hypothetical protein
MVSAVEPLATPEDWLKPTDSPRACEHAASSGSTTLTACGRGVEKRRQAAAV